MSWAASPGTGLVYGLERVCAVWGVPRSSFYAEQRKAVDPTKPAARRRGPKPKISDENLLAAIVADLEASPFEGEGFRKVWARLRVQQGIRVSRTRLRVLMRDNSRLTVPAAATHVATTAPSSPTPPMSCGGRTAYGSSPWRMAGAGYSRRWITGTRSASSGTCAR